MMTRRRHVVIAGLAALVVPHQAGAEPAPVVQVWRDPNCGCCGDWIAHMREHGFIVEEHVVRSVGAIRRMLATPSDLLSCHAARIGDYVLEGHVPALAVKRLLGERPGSVRGLAVPGMPIGSPGMDVPGEQPDTYDVIAFGSRPHTVFMRFRGGVPL